MLKGSRVVTISFTEVYHIDECMILGPILYVSFPGRGSLYNVLWSSFEW